MTAPQLLENIEARGGSIAVATGPDGAPQIQIAPRGIVSDLANDIRRLKPELIDLLESAPAHRWQSAAAATIGSAAMAPGIGAPDVSAMAPDVLPQLTQGESAALLARYRAGGAVLTLERVEHDGAQSLALGIELTARVAPEKRARAFQRITNHESRFRIGARARTGKRAHNRRRRGGIALRARRSGIRGAAIDNMKLLNITPETLANNAQCKNRDARRYLNRRHAGVFNGEFYRLTAEQAGKAVDALRGRGGVYSSRVGCSATYSQLANSNAPLISKREK